MYKTQHARTAFGSFDVEKLHAAVARSTFASQNVKKLTVTDHFLKFRVLKSNFRQYGQLKKQSRVAESCKKQRTEVESEERRYNCAKIGRKKIQTREVLGKSRNAMFFQ